MADDVAAGRYKYLAMSRNSLIASRVPTVCPLQGFVQTVIEVVVNQDLFRRAKGALDRVQLLHDVHARLATLDHRNDVLQVPTGALQAVGHL